jgi:hypothetical protein
MHYRQFLLAAAILASIVAAASATEPLRSQGFGPPVGDDASLNGNLGVLAQNIAWRQSPESDVFLLAIAPPEEAPFANVAMESEALPGPGFSPAVRDDPSLNANETALAQWIAYRNSPKGDAFHVAEPETAVASATFMRVTLASMPRAGMERDGQ